MPVVDFNDEVLLCSHILSPFPNHIQPTLFRRNLIGEFYIAAVYDSFFYISVLVGQFPI